MAVRNAASVLPDPVGAAMSVCRPVADGRPAATLRGGRLAEGCREPPLNDWMEGDHDASGRGLPQALILTHGRSGIDASATAPCPADGKNCDHSARNPRISMNWPWHWILMGSWHVRPCPAVRAAYRCARHRPRGVARAAGARPAHSSAHGRADSARADRLEFLGVAGALPPGAGLHAAADAARSFDQGGGSRGGLQLDQCVRSLHAADVRPLAVRVPAGSAPRPVGAFVGSACLVRLAILQVRTR